MRLRCDFRDPLTFLRCMQTMAKLSSKCILRCSPDDISMVVPRGTDSVEAWLVLDDLPHFFREYRVESNFQNQVNLEVSTDLVCQALRSTTSASKVTMKLGKRDTQPTLTFEIVTRSPAGQDVSVTQDCMISVKKPREMMSVKTADEAVKDREGQYHVVSRFPDLAEVRVVADRMRTMDPSHDRLIISANRAGEVRMAMQGDEVKMETQWQDLQPVEEHEATNGNEEALRRFKYVRLDAKAFLKFLACPLTDYETEVWIVPKACATFIVHVRSASGQDRTKFVAHLMINLPGLDSGYDDV